MRDELEEVGGMYTCESDDAGVGGGGGDADDDDDDALRPLPRLTSNSKRHTTFESENQAINGRDTPATNQSSHVHKAGASTRCTSPPVHSSRTIPARWASPTTNSASAHLALPIVRY
jgi:hypothetical protein